MKPEQRKHLRRTVQVEFRAQEGSGLVRLAFDSADVSAGGVFLRTDLLLEEGEALTLEFDLPGAKKSIQARGKVAWVRRFPADGEEAGLGVAFTDIAPEDLAAIEQFTSR